MAMSARLREIMASYRRLPGWVQIWVAWLVLVNGACLALLDTVSGQAVALAALLVVAGNLPLMWHYAGMNRALSIPHLFAWIPLQVFLIQHLLRSPGLGQVEVGYALLVLVVNGISLAFDLLDSWRWLRGERATP